jgi:hypothetical protein
LGNALSFGEEIKFFYDYKIHRGSLALTTASEQKFKFFKEKGKSEF